jgi:MraZ protein
MFIGSYYNKLEEKGRITLPKEFRQEGSDFVITRGLDGGLLLFKQADFQEELDKLTALSYLKSDHRQLIRFLAGSATTVTPDKLGRINLPPFLVESAGLQKNVVLVGAATRVEIWDQDNYHRLLDNLTSQATVIAERVEL